MESLENRTLLSLTSFVEEINGIDEVAPEQTSEQFQEAFLADEATYTITGITSAYSETTGRQIHITFSAPLESSLTDPEFVTSEDMDWYFSSHMSLVQIPDYTPVELTDGTFAWDDTTNTLTWTLNGELDAGYYELLLEGMWFPDNDDHELLGGSAGLQFSVVPLGSSTQLKSGLAQATPVYTDWNGDGVTDLLVGCKVGSYGKIMYYQNTGTNASPTYATGTYLKASDGSDFSISLTGGTGISLAATNYDSDTYPDLIVGMANGTIRVLKNVNGTGTLNNPNGTETYLQHKDRISTNLVNIDVGTNATVSLCDLDNDDDLDLLIGSADGSVWIGWNTGAWTFQTLEKVLVGGFALDVGDRSAPAVSDLNGDGRLDLLVGAADGSLTFFENIGSITDAQFAEGVALTRSDNTAITVSSDARPAIYDVNLDGRVDVIVGNGGGGTVVRYLAIGDPTVTEGPIVCDYDGTNGFGGGEFRYVFSAGTQSVGYVASIGSDRICNEGDSLSFTLMATLDGTSLDTSLYNIIWDFGDGTETQTGLLTRSHTYTQTGSSASTTYTATVQIVRKSTGQTVASTSSLVTVRNIAPTVTINDPGKLNSGQSVTLSAVATDVGGDTLSYRWYVNETQVGTGATLTRSFTDGTYTVRLTVTDPSGAIGSDTQEIHVGNAASPTLSPIANTTVLAGAPQYIGLDGSDTDGDSLTYEVIVDQSGITNGTLSATVFTSETNRSLRLALRSDDGTIDGELVFQLFDNLTPQTVQRIVEMVVAGNYESLAFTTMRKDVAMTLQSGTVTTKFDDEFHEDLQFTSAGLLALARADNADDTNQQAIMITFGENRSNDFDRTIFGTLTSGQELLELLNVVSTTSGTPTKTVRIVDAQVETDSSNAVLQLKAESKSDATISGSAIVTVKVSDGATTTTRTFTVNAGADTVDNTPFLKTIAPVEMVQGTTVTVQLPAVDMEGNAITYRATGSSDGGIDAVVSSTGLLTITSQSTTGRAGGYVVSVTVSQTNLSGSDTQRIPVIVSPAAPVIVGLTTESDSGSSATDRITSANNSSTSRKLSFSLSGLTNGAVVTLYADGKQIASGVASGATLTLTTDGSTILSDGDHTITATQKIGEKTYVLGNSSITKTLTSTTSAPLTITVDSTAPAFGTFPDGETVAKGEGWTYTVTANETIASWNLSDAPAGMSINTQTGVIQWTATATENLAAGYYTATVTMVDVAGNTKSQSFRITLKEATVTIPVPQNLKATPKTNAIQLNWNSVTAASTYYIEAAQYTTGTPQWFQAGSGSSTTFTYSVPGSVRTYMFRVRAVDRSGNKSAYSSVVTATALDLTVEPPTTPKNLKAQVVSATSISLTWTASTTATAYVVERSPSGNGAWTTVATTENASYTDTGLTASTKYYYRVTASNEGGNSAATSSVNATTSAAPPAAPTGLKATVSGTQIQLNWTAVDTAKSYVVERSLNGTSDWSQIAAPKSNSYTDSGLGGSTTYYYRVSAVNTVGTGVPSAVVSGTTPMAPPATPTGVVVTPVSGSELKVSWTAVAGATSYIVERSANGRGGWTSVTNGTTELSVTDSGLSGGTKYYYRVTAANSTGRSDASANVNGTTLPGIVFKAKAIKEATKAGTSAGTFSLSNRAKATYTLLDDADGLFTVDSRGNLVTTRVADYEAYSDTNGVVTVTVQASPAGGGVIDPIEVSVQIQNVDEAPENLTFTGGTVEEFAPVGTVIGTLSATDPEGDAVSYVISKKNAYVTIQGNQLVVAKQFLYSQVSQIDVSVQAQSGSKKSVAQAITIRVTQKDYSNLTDPITVNMPSNKVTVSQSGGQILVMNGRNTVFSAKAQGFPGLIIVGTSKADTVTWELSGWTVDVPFTFQGNGGGKDTLIVNGTGGNDELTFTSDGIQYRDTLVTLSGANLLTVQGNAGDDTYRFEQLPTNVATTISDKGGFDTFDFSGATSGVTVDMNSTKAQSLMGGSLTLKQAVIELVIGSDFADTIQGAKAGMVIFGGDGADRLSAVGGKNVLIGGDGSDTLTSTAGENLLIGDQFRDSAATEQIFSTLYNDWIASKSKFDDRTSSLSNRLDGWFEDDDETDTLIGGKGQDWFFGTLGEQVQNAVTTGRTLDKITE